MSGLEGLLAGRLLGDRYRIEEVIGRGGMGAVYRATDERLGRAVAVKVITVAGGTDPVARDRLRARFQREARAAAALPHHPNVVPVYDYGSDTSLGLDYLVMELLRGQDLSTHLSALGPPPLAASIRILYEAALGVAVGHRAGLIHRDVKPGNIFLARTGPEEIQVRVVDFGIAKLMDDEDSLAQLTQDGRVPHSPAYASPEQLRGLSSLTPASDVFSLGAVGYTLLTGQRPFTESDRNRMALGMAVSPAAPRTLNPAIPAGISEILERALSFDPPDRYDDAGEMAREMAGAMRAIGETPLEPYGGAMAGGAMGAGAGAPDRHAPAEDDDVTRLLEPDDAAGATGGTRSFPLPAGEDDRTLAAPGGSERPLTTAPTGSGDGEPDAVAGGEKAFPPRRRKRGIGGIIVWLLVLAVLAAAMIAILTEGTDRRPRVEAVEEEPDSIPAPPDSVPTIVPETPIADSIDSGSQPEIRALVLNLEGQRLAREGDFAGAVDNLRRATELAPGSADYAMDYGHTLIRMGRSADAAAQFERAAELAPQRADAYFNLGAARLVLGDTASAWNALQRAVTLSENRAERAAALRHIQAIEQARSAAPAPTPGSPPRDTASVSGDDRDVDAG